MSITRRDFLGSSIGSSAVLAELTAVETGQRHRPIPLPAEMRLWDLATPALVVDADSLESNLRKMRDFYSDNSAVLRPHASTRTAQTSRPSRSGSSMMQFSIGHAA